MKIVILKTKIGFSFKIEGDNRNKEELLIIEDNTVTLENFKTIKQAKVVSYQQLSKYEDAIWKNEEILEPLEEMKTFKSED